MTQDGAQHSGELRLLLAWALHAAGVYSDYVQSALVALIRSRPVHTIEAGTTQSPVRALSMPRDESLGNSQMPVNRPGRQERQYAHRS